MTHPTSSQPNLSKKVSVFVNSLNNENLKPLYELSPKEAREFLINLQSEYSVKNIETTVEDTIIQIPEGKEIKIRIVRPKNNEEKLPVILYLHGGGWILGGIETHDNLIKKLSLYSNSVVIFVEYSLSPEAIYPTAINEAFEILKYIYKNEDIFNIDRNKIVLAGDSAGGNMATVLAAKTAKEQGPEICFQALFYPVTDAKMNTQSYKDFENGPWLSKKAMEWFWDAYTPDKNIRNKPEISPINAEEKDLKILPPTLIITAENDILRDEGENYAKKLDNAGVKVFNIRINGTIHDFMMLNALENSQETQGAIFIAGKIIKNALYKK